MDIVEMVMGAAVASIVWIACVPWSRLRRLKELEERAAERCDKP